MEFVKAERRRRVEWPRLSLAPDLAGVEAVTVCQAAVSVSASVKQRRLLVSPVTKIQPAARSSLTCWLATPVMFLSSWPAGTLPSEINVIIIYLFLNVYIFQFSIIHIFKIKSIISQVVDGGRPTPQ